MTELKKAVRRTSFGLVREKGKPRQIVIILRPPNILGFRAKGCRREYQLTSEVCYTMAVRAHVAAAKKAKKKIKNRKG